MRKPMVADVMTRDVVTVTPETPVQDIARLLLDRGISSVPVVSEQGMVLGVVSEADLLRRRESDADPQSWWAGGPAVRRRWRKAPVTTARELMSLPVLAVPSEAFLPAAARLLGKADVHRLFVVDDGRLVGVLAHRDLLRPSQRADEDIRVEIEQQVLQRVLWAEPNAVTVAVAGGVVSLSGRLDYQADVDIAVRLIPLVPGVVAVRNNLTYLWANDSDSAEPDPVVRSG